MRSINFSRKVFGAAVAVILITVLGVYMAALPTIERSLVVGAEQRVEREAAWAVELCKQSFNSRTGEFDTTRFAAAANPESGTRFTLMRPDGRVLFDSHREAAGMDDHSSRAEFLTPGAVVTRFSRTFQKEMTYYALPIRIDGKIQGYSRVAVAVEDRETRLVGLRRAIRNGALGAAFLSLLLAGYFARRITRPLSEIAGLITELGSTQTKRRLREGGQDEVGRLAQAVNRLADDLQRKTARVERDRAEREAIFSALASGLLAVDQDHKVLFLNQRGRDLLGGLEGDPKGTPVWELTRNRALIEVIDHCLEEGGRAGGETRMPGEDGERILEIRAVAMEGRSSEEWGCVLELRDVSDLRRLEEVRRDFVSNVSHELKTPLTAMRGFTEAILENEDMPDEVRRSFLEKAHRNTERLTAIVGDLLSLSRLESSANEFALEDLQVVGLVRNVLDDLGDLAESHQTRLLLVGDEPDPRVRADMQALAMAVSNLVSNAIQYSPENGEVRIVVTAEGDEARIDVIDRGPGIPQHEQERVFERFYRVDKARSRTLGGTGLGLAIVRHAAAALGGRVELESKTGEGCRFSLFIPLA